MNRHEACRVIHDMRYRALHGSFSFTLCLGVVSSALAVVGCSGSKPAVKTVQSKTAATAGGVRLLVVDDRPLAEAISRQWQARAEGELEVKNLAGNQLASLTKLSADAVIYPSGLLGELAERELIAPLPQDVQADAQFDRPDLLPMARQREVTWGAQVYAVSFGSPQLVVCYRADLLERLKLEPPETWGEYQELAERLNNRKELGDLAPPADVPWHGACEPLGPGWAGQTLLARAAAYARHPDQYSALFNKTTMKPLIAGPPFVKALEELAAAAKQGSAESVKFSPHDVRQEFLLGRCGLALTWPTAARIDIAAASDEKVVAAGISELPGSSETFDFSTSKWDRHRGGKVISVPLLSSAGRLGSITQESRRAKSAASVLVWLSGREWSPQISTQSSEATIFRASHVAQPQAWLDAGLDPAAAGQYSKAVEQANNRSVWLTSPNIPGRGRYLAVLDKAVHDALAEIATPADALKKAADEWAAITQELGIEKQRLAYQRSLGLEP